MVSFTLQNTARPLTDDRLLKLLPTVPIKEFFFNSAKFQTPGSAIPILISSVAPSLSYLGFWLEGSYLTPEAHLWLDFFEAADNLEHVDFRRNEDWPMEFTEAVLRILVTKPKLAQLDLAGVNLSPGCLSALVPLFASKRAQDSSAIFAVRLTNTRPSRRPQDVAAYAAAMQNLMDTIRVFSHEIPLREFQTDEAFLLSDGKINTEVSNKAFLKKMKFPFSLLSEKDTHPDLVKALYKSVDDAQAACKPMHRLWLADNSLGHLKPLRMGEDACDASPWGVQSQTALVKRRVGHMVLVSLPHKGDLTVEAEYLEPLVDLQKFRAKLLPKSLLLPIGTPLEFVRNKANVLGVVAGYEGGKYVVVSPILNERFREKGSTHPTALVDPRDCWPASVFRWADNKSCYYLLSFVDKEILLSLNEGQGSIFRGSIVNHRSFLPLTDWLSAVQGLNHTLVQLYYRPESRKAKKHKSEEPSTEADDSAAKIAQSQNSRTLQTPATASKNFDPEFYESRKVLCISDLMDPKPETYSVPLFPCFFVEWAVRGKVKLANVVISARNKDDSRSTRTALISVPEFGVYFLNEELAKSQGLDVPRNQDANFRSFAHTVGPVIMQPWKDLDGQAQESRIVVRGKNYASLHVNKLALIPTLGNGLDVRESRVPNGGRGLYATRSFETGEIISMYSGHKFGELQRRGMQELGLGTHCKPLEQKLAYLDGVKLAFKGMPVAQLANHGGSLTNASFVTIEVTPTGDKVVAIKANRFIYPGEEIYLNYGLKFWSEQNYVPLPAPDVVLPSGE